MRFRMGEMTLFSRSFERLHMNAGPIVATTDPEQGHAELVANLFARLRPVLTRRQVIYLEGVAVGGEVERALAAESTRRLYKIVQPTPGYERRLIRLPSTFEEYLGSLKSQTRQNLRNTQRKLEKHLTGNLRLLRCSDIDQIPDFVRRAVAISKKTYQWHLLGLGLRKPDELERTLAAMARHGWTRCYLLECGGVATAFMIGYLYAGTYYYVDVGFDPDWEKWSVGTVLHLEVLRDLVGGEGSARSFDFSSGSGIHKKRFSNESRGEANYLLVPHGARNNILIAAFRGMDAVSAVAVGLLDRLHLKTAIKRLVRRHATDKTNDD
jgi:CelD/BcsL family acetyltransferase involved in cellulose biosynthesis